MSDSKNSAPGFKYSFLPVERLSMIFILCFLLHPFRVMDAHVFNRQTLFREQSLVKIPVAFQKSGAVGKPHFFQMDNESREVFRKTKTPNPAIPAVSDVRVGIPYPIVRGHPFPDVAHGGYRGFGGFCFPK